MFLCQGQSSGLAIVVKIFICLLIIVVYVCSTSNPWLPLKANRMHYSCKRVSDLDQFLSCWGNLRKRCRIRFVLLENGSNTFDFGPVGCRKQHLTFQRSRRMGNLFTHSSADDGVTVNGTPQASTSSDVEEMRVKLNWSLHSDSDSNDGLVPLLHESARVFELAIKEQSPFSKLSWFSTAWLGVDRNAWVKALSYQVWS